MSKAIAWVLVGFVAGAAVGYGVAHSRDASESDPAATTPLAADRAGERVSEILAQGDTLERVRQLSALLPRLGPEAVPALLEAYERAPLDGGDPELVLLATWWARLDPEAAYAWTHREWRAQFGAVLAAVFRSWAHVDPEAAAKAAQGVRFDSQRSLAVDAAIAGWDESGKPGLLDYVRQLDDTPRQRAADIVARRRVVTLGAQAALEWVDSLGDRALQEMMAPRIAAAVALAEPERATEWAEPRIRAAAKPTGLPRRIGTRWIRTDPEAALAWLATLPEGADRDDGIEESFRDWLRRDPPAARAWIEKVPMEPWNEPAFAIYARGPGSQDPRAAIAMVDRFSDEKLRTRTLIVIGRSWLRDDREAAEAWLEASGLPEDVKRRARMVRTMPTLRERLKARAEAEAALEAEEDL